MRHRATLAAIAALPVTYWFGVRPWMLRWGSRPAERGSTLPGDEVIRRATLSVTRAIDIDAPAELVWPWLPQIGVGPGRAGFYSYDVLENLIGLDIQSARRVIPELQAIAVGDRIPLGPATAFRVAALDEGHHLVLRATMHPFLGRDVEPATEPGAPWLDWSWSFVLEPRPLGTRLLLRTRGAWSSPAVATALLPVLEPVWFVMERRMLLGIRERAEAGVDGPGAVPVAVS
jgi:hypothetical protein